MNNYSRRSAVEQLHARQTAQTSSSRHVYHSNLLNIENGITDSLLIDQEPAILRKSFFTAFNNTAEIDAFQLARRYVDLAHERVHKYLDRVALSRKSRAVLDTILEGRGQAAGLLMANRHVRLKVTDLLISSLLSSFADRDERDVHFYLGTFAWDMGVTLVRRPKVRIRKMVGKVRRVLGRAGLNAIGAVECHALTRPLKGQKSRRQLWHVHVVCWADNGKLDRKKLGAKLGHNFPNSFGAKPVVFTYRKAQTDADLARLGFYLLKDVAKAKHPSPRRDMPGMLKLRTTTQGYRLSDVARLFEIYSRLNANHVLFGVRDGKYVLRPVMNQLRAWGKGRPLSKRDCSPGQIHDAWNEVHAANGNDHFEQPQIFTR